MEPEANGGHVRPKFDLGPLVRDLEESLSYERSGIDDQCVDKTRTQSRKKEKSYSIGMDVSRSTVVRALVTISSVVIGFCG